MCSQAIHTRLIILTGGKSNHKIKIAGTGQLAVSILPLECKYTSLSFLKMLTALTTCMGWGGVGGGGAKKATKVKWASHYYQYYIHYVNQYACGLSSIIALLIFFFSYFKNL